MVDRDDLVRSVLQPIVSGAMGGFGSVLVGHPFETVKARLQTGAKPSWPGFRGAYAGLLSPLTGQVSKIWQSCPAGQSGGQHVDVYSHVHTCTVASGSILGVVLLWVLDRYTAQVG